MLVKNATDIVPTGYNPASVIGTLIPTVLLKEWPSITLDVSAAQTIVKWGERLIADYVINDEENIDDISKLTISKPIWYMDGKQIDTLAQDGSLDIVATHPGEHILKAVITLLHPDYENGRLAIENSFNMTTETREMATVLKLMPTDAVVGVGKTQKFTATISGAPDDATTTYVWTVDDQAQPTTSNTMDYKATKVGTNTIKVVSTTKAQDAEDDVQEATVTMTVNKNVMAVTVLASTATPTIKLGETYSVKCDVTGQPTGATIAYKWNSGETTQSITGTGSALGPIARKCTVTVKHADYEDSVSDSNTVNITVQKKTQTTTAIASTSTPSINQDEDYKTTVTVSGAPSGATIAYLWSTGETTQNITKKQHLAGQVKLSCKVTVKHADYEDKIIDTNEVVVEVKKIVVPGVVVDISSDLNDIETGTEYTVLVKVSQVPANSTISYLWDSGDIGPEIKRSQTESGDYVHSCKVTVKHADYNDFVVDKSITVTVVDPAIAPDGCIRYIHPLDHRQSAYIWAGWWVVNEIQVASALGLDWKKPEGTVLKYQCDLKTLAKMIKDYPNIEVQESRNGYILNEAELESGYIY